MTDGLIPLTPRVRLDDADVALLERTVEYIAANDTKSIIAEVLPTLDPANAELVAGTCHFDHAGALIFPDSIADLQADLQAAGIVTGAPAPSVIVRERLSQRYGVPLEVLDVTILRAPVPAAGGARCEIEIFALATASGNNLADVVRGERTHQHESHVALRVHDTGVAPGALRSMLTNSGLVRDGGGYNGYINATILYFRNQHGQRLELIADGRHS